MARSSFFIALLLFSLTNALVSLCHVDFQENATWWRSAKASIIETEKVRRNADVIFMGSSMMRSPMWCADHDIERNIAPFVDYHGAVYFDRQVEKSGLGAVTALNLAVDGSSISDNYLLFDRLVSSTAKQPHLVVLGISPRDFIASWFFSETNTPVFRMVCKPSTFISTGQLFATNPLDWLDGFLKTVVSLPRFRGSMMHWLCQHQLLQAPSEKTEVNKLEGPQSIYAQDPDHEALVSFFFSSNLKSKLLHYENQKRCLQALLSLASQKRVHLLLVNMPVREGITQIPESIVSDYSLFLSTLRDEGISVLDLARQPDSFSTDCFIDNLHLNGKGGRQMVARLIDFLKSHQLLLPMDTQAQRIISKQRSSL